MAESRSNPWGEWTESVENYEVLDNIGEGMYGEVFRARHKTTGEIVALKKIRMNDEREGFPITAIRELKILRSLQHENIVRLKSVVTSRATDHNRHKGDIFFVFEFAEYDLAGIINNDSGFRFTPLQIKSIMHQMLRGIFYSHQRNIIHRDIKSPNILLTKDGLIKIADWGLAKFLNSAIDRRHTNRVVTLWYRAPELLLGASTRAQGYGSQMDIWSLGCLFGELLREKPLFIGNTEPEMINCIFQLCGTPNESTWQGIRSLNNYGLINPAEIHSSKLKPLFRHIPETAFDLIQRMLCLNPHERITAAEALNHDYFRTESRVFGNELANLALSSIHDAQAKKRRMQQNGRESKRHNSTFHSQSTHPQVANNPHSNGISFTDTRRSSFGNRQRDRDRTKDRDKNRDRESWRNRRPFPDGQNDPNHRIHEIRNHASSHTHTSNHFSAPHTKGHMERRHSHKSYPNPNAHEQNGCQSHKSVSNSPSTQSHISLGSGNHKHSFETRDKQRSFSFSSSDSRGVHSRDSHGIHSLVHNDQPEFISNKTQENGKNVGKEG